MCPLFICMLQCYWLKLVGGIMKETGHICKISTKTLQLSLVFLATISMSWKKKVLQWTHWPKHPCQISQCPITALGMALVGGITGVISKSLIANQAIHVEIIPTPPRPTPLPTALPCYLEWRKGLRIYSVHITFSNDAVFKIQNP